MIPLIAIALARKVPTDLVVDLPDIGAWRSAEKRVLIIFGLTALAWMTRTEPFGGWRAWPICQWPMMQPSRFVLS